MWQEKHELHAAVMRERFQKQAETEERKRQELAQKEELKALEQKRKIQKLKQKQYDKFSTKNIVGLSSQEQERYKKIKRSTKSYLYDRLVKPKIVNCTEEEKFILEKHGLHTSKAADELDWSVYKVQRYGIFFGFYTADQIRNRPKGRPAGSNKPPKVLKGRVYKFVATEEIDKIIQSEIPMKQVVAATGWSLAAIRRRRIALGIGRTKKWNLKYPSNPEIDQVMREFPGSYTKVSTIIGWPIWAVERRMTELNLKNDNHRLRNDEQEIVDLLKFHHGCIADVRRELKKMGKGRSERFVKRIRDNHNIQLTKVIVFPSKKGTTPAIDKYIQSLIEMSNKKRDDYFRLLSNTIPMKLSANRIASVTNINRRTIDSYVKNGWLPVDKKEFVQFLIDQCDFAMSKMQNIESHEAARYA